MSDAELERDLQQLSGVAAGRAWTERVHVCGERDGGERRGEEEIKVHGVREAVMKARPPPKTSASDSQLRRVGLPAAGKKDARASVYARAAHSGQGGPFFPYLKNTKQSALLSPPRSATQPSPGVVPIASVVLVQRGGEALAAGCSNQLGCHATAHCAPGL